ncbi:IKI3-domain-containing protein [Viridothelium virens]|uniref:IKI3-domain-containing protein n=1 Tax=Viridothelium virens TaxID=1048519 RepID=A0A6A6HCD7_VIRVR|nr:IKI3-domain-containing protein [Viridothelium virens]
MRNLKNIGCSTSEIGGITATTWDVNTDSLICANGPVGPEDASALITLKRIRYPRGLEVEETEIAAWDVDGPLPDPSKDKILSLHYLPDIATICLILAGGDIYIVREEPEAGQERIEIVGSVDAGITAADWSPDEELLAISTGAGTFLFMTREFEEVTNVTFGPEDLKLSKHVSVGWGKSETQFKGKRVKALRDPTVPEHVDEGTLSSCDDGQSRISWRGDGAYVAINTIESGNRRIVRVYSREGILDSVSEPVDGLEGSLSWRPAGNLIAGVQRSKEYAQVVFFERNGLRHGQFRLRLTQQELEDWGLSINLRWNNDSTVLAISYLNRVQLWTMGNYHYYLKQEIHFGSAGNVQGVHPAVGISWHPEQPLRLSVYSICAEMDLSYTPIVAGGSTFIPNDHGWVSVIDGCDLKVTPLKRANVPPPMSLHEVSLDRNATDVAVSRSGAYIVTLDQRQVTVLKHDYETDGYSIASRHDITVDSAGRTLPRQVVFGRDSEIVFLVYSEDSHKDVIYKAALDQGKVTSTTLIELPFSISCLISALDHGSIFLESTSGSIYELEYNQHDSDGTNGINGTTINEPAMSAKELLKNPPWPKSCPKIEIWQSDEKRIIFGLTATGTLYATEPWSGRQGSQLARNCTSFLVTQAHLIFTTSQHLLKFVHLTAHHDLEVPSDEPETDERCRSIERGAQLVTVMPSSYAVVLQMPRGNLETIYPRALVLAGIRKSIITKDYKTAFLACRNHRVDMNILHDYDPRQFMANVSLFVKQIKKIEHIDLFLSQLRDENVCQTMYKETLQFSISDEVSPQTNGVSYNAPIAEKSKVNRICDAFLQALGGLRESHLQNIITAHVCKAPPDLDAALSLIGRLREHGDDSAERAVEHICFLADVNQLYNHALGLYELDLTLLVAQQSQKV